MVKASAGGGGKGLRIVHREKRTACRRSDHRRTRPRPASATTGCSSRNSSPSRAISKSRCMGDKHGNVIHLSERECSIQRRHQKVIEEAPSPFLDAATRAAMGAAGGRAGEGRRLRQRRHGRIHRRPRTEFLFPRNEHAAAGRASGDGTGDRARSGRIDDPRRRRARNLPLAQKDVKLNGWAIESRVYAEDPYRGFLPSTGRLVRYRPPAEGTHERRHPAQRHRRVRRRRDFDLLRSDDRQALYRTRQRARRRSKRWAAALDAFRIEGISHNIDFLAAIMHHPRFREGRLTTGFIAEEYPGRLSWPCRSTDRAHAPFRGRGGRARESCATQRASAISGTLNGRASGRTRIRRLARRAAIWA